VPRLLSSLAVLGVLTPAFLGLSVYTAPVATPHPVAPTVSQVLLAPLATGGATGPALRRTSHGVAPRTTRSFSTVGVTWRDDPRVEDPVVNVRWRKGSTWSPWTLVPGDRDDVPDAGSVDTKGDFRMGTSPMWVGPSNGVEAKVETSGGVRPQDLRVELVDPGASAADARSTPRDVAQAIETQPTILSRAEWGADESIRRGSPSYGKTIKAGFVHHTVNANSYTAAEVPALLRSIYAYHVKSNGWSDIGYNYLVDRFGRVWEGRFGGISKVVTGAHTGGFNADTFGASLLGTYSTVAPSAATLNALEQLFAWKLGYHYRDPLAKVTLRSAGGGTSKYAVGTSHTFDVVSGHRDAGNTSCPGDATYARMGSIRRSISSRLGPGFLDPVASSSSALVGSTTPITLTAKTLRPATWTVDIVTSTGSVVRTFPGTTPDRVDVSWDLKDASGATVPPGQYTLRLTGVGADGEEALPFLAQLRYRVPSIPKGTWLRPGGYRNRFAPTG